MTRTPGSSGLLLAALLGAACGSGQPGLRIGNARVADGTGAPIFSGAVRVEAGAIVAVGPDVESVAGDVVVDAGGMVLAPGFIDVHSHADRELLDTTDAAAAVSQGATTLVVGQDGGSPWPLADFRAKFESSPAPVNVASYAGHNTLRLKAMGEDYKRAATPGEIARMAELLREELAAGALGLSTGLEYDPGVYSSTEEVIELARVAAEAGGRYISHLRSEDRWFHDALDELLRIGEETGMPIQWTHAKLALRSLWGGAGEAIAKLEAARARGVDVTLDVYPWRHWQSTLTVLFPERDFEDLEEARFVVDQLAQPEEILLPVFAPEPAYEGRTLQDVADERGEEPAAALLALIRDAEAMRAQSPSGPVETVIAASMHEDDVATLFAWEHASLSTDGSLLGAHPRGWGSFPRAIRQFVRERQDLTLGEAIRRMTWNAARQMGFDDRGRIAPGFVADLVLFDPETISDRATFEEPHLASAGVLRVFVAGETVFENGRVTAARPGRFLVP